MYGWSKPKASKPVDEWRTERGDDARDASTSESWPATSTQDPRGRLWAPQHRSHPEQARTGPQRPPFGLETQQPIGKPTTHSLDEVALQEQQTRKATAQTTSPRPSAASTFSKWAPAGYVPEPPAYPMKLKTTSSTRCNPLSEISHSMSEISLSPGTMLSANVKTTTTSTSHIVPGARGTTRVQTLSDRAEHVDETCALGLWQPETVSHDPNVDDPTPVPPSDDVLSDALREIIRLDDVLHDCHIELANTRKQLDLERRATERLRAEMDEDKAMLSSLDILRQRVVELEAEAEARANVGGSSTPQESVTPSPRLRKLQKGHEVGIANTKRIASLERELSETKIERDELKVSVFELVQENERLQQQVQRCQTAIAREQVRHSKVVATGPVYSRESLLALASESPLGLKLDLTQAPIEILRTNEPEPSEQSEQRRHTAEAVGAGTLERRRSRTASKQGQSAPTSMRNLDAPSHADKPLSPPTSPEIGRNEVALDLQSQAGGLVSARQSTQKTAGPHEQGSASPKSSESAPDELNVSKPEWRNVTDAPQTSEPASLSDVRRSKDTAVEQPIEQAHESGETDLMTFENSEQIVLPPFCATITDWNLSSLKLGRDESDEEL
ncbi:hypothetical protein ACM66B_005994 [Microbotryomycetes sp. NB124-2]